MAAQSKLFQRLIWLVDTIYSAGHISRDEIDRRWSSARYNDMHETEYGERNFHRHRETIQEMFGIEIVCNRTTKEYSIQGLDEANGAGMRSWLMNTFAINNMVNLGGGMEERILFETIPEGTRYLSTIVNAMRDGKKLYISYQNFVRPEPHSFLLAPYCLKLSKRRWYVIGKPIKVKMSAYDANYMRTLPIHGSQFELERNDEYSIFGFYVAPTYDFIQELRKFGSTLEVLEPAHLRDEFKEESENLAKMYEK